MNDVVNAQQERMKKTIANLKDEFSVVRTGRASPNLLDKIRVEYYGDKTPIAQVANISVPEARLIVIQPWEKTLIGEIEKAIRSSELSLNPSNDGKVIRIAIPPLTEERRKEMVKLAKNIAEQSRVAIRNIRRDGNDELKKMQKDAVLSEDELVRAEDELQKMTDMFVKDINLILEEKEKEILEV